jgi:tetratricopeptide (TPR) repeat protein
MEELSVFERMSDEDKSVLIAQRFYDNKEYKVAEIYLHQQLKKYPNEARLHMWLGMVYRAIDFSNGAIVELIKAQDLDPNIGLYPLIGVVLYERGNLESAELDFKMALRENPDDHRAHFFLGRIFDREGFDELAIKEYLISADNDTNEITKGISYGLAGHLYFFHGQLDSAIEEFNKSILYNPNDGEVYFYLGKCYEKQGQKDLAKISWCNILSVNC